VHIDKEGLHIPNKDGELVPVRNKKVDPKQLVYVLKGPHQLSFAVWFDLHADWRFYLSADGMPHCFATVVFGIRDGSEVAAQQRA
jgi:hypothetical protein